MVSINELRRRFKDNLQDGVLILSKLLNVDKSYIYSFGEREVSKEVEDKFIELMNKRQKGYPIQYLIGEKEFMGLDFYIKEGVLIPRFDTEVLVEYIIEYINENYKDKNIRVLDLCSGSGAIALSIAHYCKNAFVYGVDISDTAIEVSNINKERFNLRNAKFLKGDLFEALKGLGLEDQFEIIASNPPYISKEEIESLDRTVKDFEPLLALDGGQDGLDFYRRITEGSKTYLKKDGLLIYEVGYKQGGSVKGILRKAGFEDISILKDLQGHNRVVFGYKRN